jgi:hypothetical protein
MRAEWGGDDLRHAASGGVGFTPSQATLIRMKASACCAVAQTGVIPCGLNDRSDHPRPGRKSDENCCLRGQLPQRIDTVSVM